MTKICIQRFIFSLCIALYRFLTCRDDSYTGSLNESFLLLIFFVFCFFEHDVIFQIVFYLGEDGAEGASARRRCQERGGGHGDLAGGHKQSDRLDSWFLMRCLLQAEEVGGMRKRSRERRWRRRSRRSGAETIALVTESGDG